MKSGRAFVVALLALAALNLAACSSGSTNARTIEVDFNSDDFAGSFLDYFPRDVTLRPGMTVHFHQTWTGAPHTVTFVNESELTTGNLPTFFRGGRTIAQDAAQPCYVKTLGELPADHRACSKAHQVQPAFDGSYAYYSSGLIQPEGSNANRFSMKIAKNAKPGTYFYYCNLHGKPMSGHLTISATAAVKSQKELNRQGRAQAKQLSAPLLAEYRLEKAGKGKFTGNLAGSGDPSVQGSGAEVNEFTPRTIYTNVGVKVSWTFVGNHSISFNVPSFTPLYKTLANGDIVVNNQLDEPAGGWPGAPPGHKPYPAISDEQVHLDAGNFDGSGGLKSSGVGFNSGDTYAVTFTKAGTYPYACLIHPGMIGKVVVK